MSQLQKNRKRHYRIVVGGSLSGRWAEVFAGFDLRHQEATTEISGPIADSAALHGILNRIRDFNLELISVARVTKE